MKQRTARPTRRRGAPRPLVVLVAVLGVVGSACSYTFDLGPLPPASESSEIVFADGSPLATLDAGELRVPVALDALAPVLRDAVVAIEDHRFWDHSGIDLRAVGRALAADASAGAVAEGGSTITQQYVRNVLLGREQTISRKLKEAALALEVERQYSKEEILRRYLNVVYFGNGAYGAQAAAERYFGVDAADLDLDQAALLAAVIRAPEHYDPFAHADAARARRDLVLDKMVEYGFTDAARARAAKARPLGVSRTEHRRRYPAAHFVEQVKRFVLGDPAFGETRDERRRLLYQGGLHIETTLDPRLQHLAEDAIDKVLLDPAHDPAAALVALDPANGHVLAYVGGRDFFGDGAAAEFDLAGQARRQAGSAFKPFVLAAALEDGIPLSRTYEAPAELEIPLRGQAPWKVHNYAGESFGPTDLVEATVRSLNTVYAQLVMDVGPRRVVDLARELGITTPLQAVPAAALGVNGVDALDMASAYSSFAADGLHAPPAFVTRVTDQHGKVLWEEAPRADRVLPAETARRVTSVLTQVVSAGTGVNARIGRPVAGKTGTGEEWRDAWFVGYTPELVASVWVGFPDATRPMVPPTTRARVTGGLWPAQIWGLFAGAALAETPISRFPAPADADLEPAPVPLPSVVGMPGDRAVELLADAGWPATTETRPDAEYPPGTVLAQDPAGHAPTVPGTSVRLVLAGGPPAATTVPDLLGLLADEAATRAADAGLAFDLVVEAEPPPGSPARAARSWKQAPASGTRVDRGTTVSVWVNP